MITRQAESNGQRSHIFGVRSLDFFFASFRRRFFSLSAAARLRGHGVKYAAARLDWSHYLLSHTNRVGEKGKCWNGEQWTSFRISFHFFFFPLFFSPFQRLPAKAPVKKNGGLWDKSFWLIRWLIELMNDDDDEEMVISIHLLSPILIRRGFSWFCRNVNKLSGRRWFNWILYSVWIVTSNWKRRRQQTESLFTMNGHDFLSSSWSNSRFVRSSFLRDTFHSRRIYVAPLATEYVRENE